MQQRPAVLSVKKAAAPVLTLADVISQVAGDAALLTAVKSIDAERIVTLEGIWPGAVAPVLAAWIQQQQKPLLVVCAHVAEAESLAAELGELSAAARVEVLPPGSEDHEFESLQHQETAQRLHVLSWLYQLTHQAASAKPPTQVPVVVTTLPALLQSVPSPKSLEGDKRILQSGKQVDLDGLRKWLIDAGYHATSSVQLPGEFAMRGGIFDIYPPDEPMPVRVELFDDEIESLRTFDIASQRSIEPRDRLTLIAVQGSIAQDGSPLDYLPNACQVVVYEQNAVLAAGNAFLARVPFPERFVKPEEIWKRLATYPLILARNWRPMDTWVNLFVCR